MSVAVGTPPATPSTKSSADLSEKSRKRKPKLSRQDKKAREENEIKELERRLSLPITHCTLFSELPLSASTLEGLQLANFTHTTEIQKMALPIVLRGKDVLGAAKTGSGKTISFVVPILEMLYRKRWSFVDGLGAIILSPTRELAIQIFTVLRKIGSKHPYSAGLVIGGKDVQEEQLRISRMNILVATPGRLLQHLDQTVGFDVSRVQMLVLDEADRILDMGFEKALTAILEHLPRSRQTLLFSATQTKSVRDLARLSLVHPEYIAVHEASEQATPSQLQQNCLVCPLEDKLDILYSFIKSHLSQKTVIFVSTCKQVRYYYESFCRLRPGIPLMQLHGKLKQAQRISIFYDFSKKKAAVLFCTDIAARGLDFPAIDWVVQLDCPDDTDTYIHRVGRTARYDKGGRALLCLLPSEESGMMALFQKRKIPIIKKNVNPKKTVSVQTHLEQFCARDPEMKYLAQKAFVTYVRSIYFQKNKEVFNANALPLEAFARALGLPGTPRLRVVQATSSGKNGKTKHQVLKIDGFGDMEDEDSDLDDKNGRSESAKPAEFQGKHTKFDDVDQSSESEEEEGDSSSDEEERETTKPMVSARKIDKMFKKKNQNVLSEHYAKLVELDDGDDDETGNRHHKNAGNNEDNSDSLFELKRKDHELTSHDEKLLDVVHLPKKLSHRDRLKMMKRYKLKHGTLPNKIVFDDDGAAVPVWKLDEAADFVKRVDVQAAREEYVSEQKEKLRKADVVDKEREREKRREKKRLLKMKEKERRLGRDELEMTGGAVLASHDDSDNDMDYEDAEEHFSHDESLPSHSDKKQRRAMTLEEEETLALSLLSKK